MDADDILVCTEEIDSAHLAPALVAYPCSPSTPTLPPPSTTTTSTAPACWSPCVSPFDCPHSPPLEATTKCSFSPMSPLPASLFTPTKASSYSPFRNVMPSSSRSVCDSAVKTEKSNSQDYVPASLPPRKRARAGRPGLVRCSFSIGTPSSHRRRFRAARTDKLCSVQQRLDFSCMDDISPPRSDVSAVRIQINHSNMHTSLTTLGEARAELRHPQSHLSPTSAHNTVVQFTKPTASSFNFQEQEEAAPLRVKFECLPERSFMSEIPVMGQPVSLSGDLEGGALPNESSFDRTKERIAEMPTDDIKRESRPEKKCCRCKKSKCLKLYCECFARGETCGPECQCNQCLNTSSNTEERHCAIISALSRDPQAFQPKVLPAVVGGLAAKHHRGCHCVRSGCRKKYCECFQAGVLCTDLCKCSNCLNGDCSKMRNGTSHSSAVLNESKMFSTPSRRRLQLPAC